MPATSEAQQVSGASPPNGAPAHSPRGRPKRNTLTLWILLAVCGLPFVAATLLFIFAPPKSTMNYGEVIEPHPLTDFSAERLDGGKLTLADLKGHWTLAHYDSAECA